MGVCFRGDIYIKVVEWFFSSSYIRNLEIPIQNFFSYRKEDKQWLPSVAEKKCSGSLTEFLVLF